MADLRSRLHPLLALVICLLLGVTISYTTALIAVVRGDLRTIRTRLSTPNPRNMSQHHWPFTVPADWPAQPTRLSHCDDWGLRWREWGNDMVDPAVFTPKDPSEIFFPVERDFLIEGVQELRAGWPLPCVRWWGMEQVNAGVSTVGTPTLHGALKLGSWSDVPLANWGGVSGYPRRAMPLIPIPLNLLASSVLWGGPIFAIVFGPGLLRRWRHHYCSKHGLCLRCRYPLLTSADRCPECGEPYGPSRNTLATSATAVPAPM